MKSVAQNYVLLIQPSAGISYETPSYAHALGSGNRLSLTGYVTTSGAAPMWGLINNNIAYGFEGDTTSDTWGYTNNAVAVANEWLMFDLSAQAAATYKIEEIKIYFSNVFDCGTFKVQAYISGAWVDVSSNFTMGASATQTITLTGATGLTKFRFLGVSGTSSWNAYWREIEMKIGGQL